MDANSERKDGRPSIRVAVNKVIETKIAKVIIANDFLEKMKAINDLEDFLAGYTEENSGYQDRLGKINKKLSDAEEAHKERSILDRAQADKELADAKYQYQRERYRLVCWLLYDRGFFPVTELVYEEEGTEAKDEEKEE